MRAWLRPILDRLIMGLVPLDGDIGRPAPAAEKIDPCPRVESVPLRPRPRSDQTAWIPNTILYGPPL